MFQVLVSLVVGYLSIAPLVATGDARAPFTGKALGQVVSAAADPTAVRLPDGRIRLYVAADPGSGAAQGESSYISSDGVHFKREPGTRLGSEAGPHQRIVRLRNGRWRMFFNTPPNAAEQGIGSAVSSDGLTFTTEPGLRIKVTDAGLASNAHLSTGDVVRRADGRYRMYFSSIAEFKDPKTSPPEIVKSATSRDMLKWTVESGVRVGPGAPKLTGSAEHPSALVNPDGSVSLFYGRFLGSAPGIWVATSKDGRKFTSESRLVSKIAVDSAVVQRRDGTLLMYYGDRDTTVSDTSVIHNAVHVMRLKR